MITFASKSMYIIFFAIMWGTTTDVIACDPNEECKRCLAHDIFSGVCAVEGNDPACEVRKATCQVAPVVTDTIFQGPLRKDGVVPRSTIDKCLNRTEDCINEIVARGGYSFIRPVAEEYFRYLRLQATGKLRRIPSNVAEVLQPYFNYPLNDVQYATNIDTRHGQHITIGDQIFFVGDVNFYSCEGFILLAHELEHVAQYRRRGGIEAFSTEYVVKSAGQIVDKKSFNVHDDIDIEKAAVAKSKDEIGCTPLGKIR